MPLDADALVASLTEVLARRPDGLVTAWLHGSRARGDARDPSDVDVGVLYDAQSPPILDSPPRRLAATLEERLGKPIDVVDLDGAPPDLVHRVLRDGRLLLDADPARRIHFEIQARNAYHDLLPYLQMYRRWRAS